MNRFLIPLLLLFSCSTKELILRNIEGDNQLSGEMKWELKLPSQVSGPMNCYNGYLFAPLSGREIYVIDILTGKEFTKIHTDFIPKSTLLNYKNFYVTGIGEWNAVDGYSLGSGTSAKGRITRLFKKSADPLGGFLASTTSGPIFATNKGKIFLLDKLTGEIIARRNFYNRPIGLISQNLTAYLLLQNGSFYSFNLDSSLMIIDSLILGKTMEIPPVIDNSDIIFTVSHDSNIYALDSTLNIMWERQLEGKIETAPAFDDSLLYLLNSDGNLLILDKKSGELMRTLKSNLFSFLPPIMCGKEIVILGYDGNIVSYGKEHTEKLRLKVDGISEVATFCKGKLFIATDKKKLYCVN